jgi:acetyl/propionyl-CoA carboxylase alpha subunit
MISKLITFGKDRQEAITRMLRAIDDYKIIGPKTTLSFCKFTLQHEAFISGNFDTHFVKKYFSPDKLHSQTEDEEKIAALVSTVLLNLNKKEISMNNNHQNNRSKWKSNRLE